MHQPIQVLLELNISMQIAQNVFVNAFAANEPQSTKAILNKVESYNYPYDKKINNHTTHCLMIGSTLHSLWKLVFMCRKHPRPGW